MNNVLMYYNFFKKNNCQLSFVNSYKNDYNEPYEMWCVRDTDKGEIISFFHYYFEEDVLHYSFQKYSNYYFKNPANLKNYEDVMDDFCKNSENRMYEGV